MAMFSKELCQRKVEIWLEAEEAVALGQEYQIGTRKLTRADLKAVREELEYWCGKLAEAKAEESTAAGGGGRNRVYGIVPRDV